MTYTPKSLVGQFCEGKDFPVNKVKLEVMLRNALGSTIEKESLPKALDILRREVKKGQASFIFENKLCPRCATSMIPVILAQGRQAIYCTQDNISVPVPAISVPVM